MMRVEIGLAEPGEMLAASEHTGIVQPAQEFARVGHHFFRIGRHGAGTHHRARSLKRQIERGSEVQVETERAAVFADDAPVLAEESAVAGREDVRCGGR